MAYGDETRALNFAGNPATTEISAAEVTQSVAFGDAMVKTLTGKNDWTSADQEWAMIQTASELFASFYMRTHFIADKEDKALKHYSKGEKICEAIGNSTDDGFVVSAGDYRTNPLNADADPYRSTIGDDPADITDSDL